MGLLAGLYLAHHRLGFSVGFLQPKSRFSPRPPLQLMDSGKGRPKEKENAFSVTDQEDDVLISLGECVNQDSSSQMDAQDCFGRMCLNKYA
jgi:hypothetical protein